VVNAMSKAECEAALAQPAYVKLLQNAMTAELARVIRAEYKSEYSPELQFRPSMRCGSLVMEAVVGDTFAPKLREHYGSGGNELKLEVAGQPLLFVPQPTTTSSTTKTTTTTTKLRTATSNQPAMVTSIDEKRPDEDQFFVMGLGLTVTLVLVIAVTSVVLICVTKRGSRADQYKSKDGAGGDEDVEVHVVSVENQEKVMSDDPYEMNVEMRTMVASKINNNKEDEDGAEPKHEPEPKAEPEAKAEPESEPKAEAPTTEDSQKAAYETTVDINV
jgi:hypothetical protein